jgi:hypothetical protein
MCVHGFFSFFDCGQLVFLSNKELGEVFSHPKAHLLVHSVCPCLCVCARASFSLIRQKIEIQETCGNHGKRVMELRHAPAYEEEKKKKKQLSLKKTSRTVVIFLNLEDVTF